MLPETYECLAEKMYEILEKIKKVYIDGSKVADYWISKRFSPPEEPFLICGVDSSWGVKEFKGYALYAINAEAVICMNGLDYEKLVDVDVLLPFKHVEDRLRLYSEIVEAKLIFKVLSRYNEMHGLIDGSLVSRVIRPIPGVNKVVMKEAFEKHENILSEIKSKALTGAKEFWCDSIIYAKKFIDEISIEESNQGYMLFIEYFEKLVAYMTLVEKFKDRLVFISKHSRTNDYFKESFKPDMALFETYTTGTGFSDPSEIKKTVVDEKSKWKLPNDIHSFFVETPLTVTFVRFEHGHPIIKLELPIKIKVEDLMAKLDNLAYYCVKGYPYPLTEAHKHVVIRFTDMENIANTLGLYYEKTGREVLRL
ncbi:hypothetical protein DRO02_07025 [archaeon]|nr:MAG: hypothetical protein DRO02_07025 [archaeon]RLG63421.1 MAG: hypothetical protein DRO21_05975 [archaeon]